MLGKLPSSDRNLAVTVNHRLQGHIKNTKHNNHIAIMRCQDFLYFFYYMIILLLLLNECYSSVIK